MAKMTRSQSDRWIAGVCGGLARQFNMSSTIMRLIFVLSCLLPGPQVLIYIVLWIVIPAEGSRRALR